MGDDSVSQRGVDPGGTVLIDTASDSVTAPQACVDQLSRDVDPLDILIVSLAGTPEEWLRLLRSNLTHRPANVGFVVSGESVRSGRTQDGPVQVRDGISLRTISSVNDLVGLSISIIEYLSEWDETDQRSVVCFDSVTSVLRYAEDDRGLRFFETLTAQLHDSNVAGYFAYTPMAHDEGTLTALHPLFDHISDGPKRENGR